MSPDPLALYLAAGRAVHPWLDTAVAFVWWTAPGVFLIGAVMAIGGLTRAVATRWRIRRALRSTIRGAELYLYRPELRPVIDHHDQPREEL